MPGSSCAAPFGGLHSPQRGGIILFRYGIARRRARLPPVATVMGGSQAVLDGAVGYRMVPHGGIQFIG